MIRIEIDVNDVAELKAQLKGLLNEPVKSTVTVTPENVTLTAPQVKEVKAPKAKKAEPVKEEPPKTAVTDELTANHPNISVVNVYHMDELSNMQKTVSDEINVGTYRPKDSELPDGQLTGEDIVAADSITEDQVVDYILAKHPNITGCFAANGDSVKLAVDGLKRNKMEKKVKVIGFDANDDEIQDLKDGKVNGLIVQNPFGMGYATVVAAARASLNMGNEAVVNTGYTWVTKKNLKTDEVQKILYSK